MRLEYDKPAVGEFTIRTLVFSAFRDSAVPNFRFVFFTATVVSLDGDGYSSCHSVKQTTQLYDVHHRGPFHWWKHEHASSFGSLLPLVLRKNATVRFLISIIDFWFLRYDWSSLTKIDDGNEKCDIKSTFVKITGPRLLASGDNVQATRQLLRGGV